LKKSELALTQIGNRILLARGEAGKTILKLYTHADLGKLRSSYSSAGKKSWMINTSMMI